MNSMEEPLVTHRNGARQDQELEIIARPTTISFAAESMRASQNIAEPHKPEEKISVCWRFRASDSDRPEPRGYCWTTPDKPESPRGR